ncbi:UNVERIFIED_CONTAM: putative calcium-binding protein CML18 [Sesamum latifolium]|uniref:Calcium-binding protein CML18 n=1 Tax=Sesamum latifolium TaxID=2727402 RepID=A0AAW2Y8E0_9LAMI
MKLRKSSASSTPTGTERFRRPNSAPCSTAWAPQSPPTRWSVMSELDTDGDGFIDLNEFKAFHYGGRDEGRELKEAFDLYDKDKNGRISASELHGVLRSLGEKCSVEDCEGMISSFDVDGDGCINSRSQEDDDWGFMISIIL